MVVSPLLGIISISIIFISMSCSHTQSSSTGSIKPTIDTSCVHDKSTFRCVKYIKNYDADTVTVQIPNVHPLLGEKISVRIHGIDAPEIKGKKPCEKEAARTAQRLVESMLKGAKQIDLNNVGRDKYFRILAEVSADGKSVKDTLLNNKLAYEYNGGTKQAVDWCSVPGF